MCIKSERALLLDMREAMRDPSLYPGVKELWEEVRSRCSGDVMIAYHRWQQRWDRIFKLMENKSRESLLVGGTTGAEVVGEMQHINRLLSAL